MEKLKLEQELKEAFYWFHRHPELSYEEYETTEKIKELLGGKGVEILPLSLETGVAAVIRGREEGPVAAIRCDIDGLPIIEETGLEYRSEYLGKMHGCGHDFHMAVILGAAFLLKEQTDSLKGTVKVIFQPAEESSLGALKIIETGVLDDVEAIFGIHAEPNLPAGTLGISEGSVTAAVDRFRIKVTGCGCHGAQPDDGIDPVVISAAIIMSVQSIVSRNLNPFSPGLVSITRIEGGTTWNVIPKDVMLEGTVRTLQKEDRKLIRARLKDLAYRTAEAYGGTAEMEWIPGPPAACNDPFYTRLSIEEAKKAGYLIEQAKKSMGGEDFAFYQETIKGCFIKVGTGIGHPIHHPEFQAAPEAIMPAACYIADLTREALRSLT